MLKAYEDEYGFFNLAGMSVSFEQLKDYCISQDKGVEITYQNNTKRRFRWNKDGTPR